MRKEAQIGETVGNYTVVNIDGVLCTVECSVCHHKRILKIAEFRRSKNIHSPRVCNLDYFKTNQIVGDYNITGKKKGNPNNLRNEYLYELECRICGNSIWIPLYSIANNKYYHNAMNCGNEFYKDRIGELYDDMEIVSFYGISNSKSRNPIYECKCKVCNRHKIMSYSNIYNKKGTTHKACSMNNDICNSMYINEFRQRWANMRDRTTNPNNKKYPVYGARGISSEQFKNFVDFYDAMYNSFLIHCKQYGVHNTTLERIDVNGDYCKDNCTWATWKEQANNKQNTAFFKVIHPDGTEDIEYGIGKYEQEHSLSHNTIYMRLHGLINDNMYDGKKYILLDDVEVDN